MPLIAYEYTVNNQVYQSDNVLPRPLAGFKAWAEGILKNYPVGTVQTAYYNPVQPEQSYLQPTKFSAVYYGAMAFGILLLVLGATKLIHLTWLTFRA